MNDTTSSETPQSTLLFTDFGLNDSLLKAIAEAKFTQPSPIQEKVIPIILNGQDVVAQAQTGTGKTAAFGLPSLNRLDKAAGVGLLVITPTRELAVQVSDELYRLGKYCGIRTIAVYGGQSIQRQIDGIERGAQVVVATPGRLLDLLKSRRLSHFSPPIVVLDEADEMLNMGFLEDIQEIFTFLPKERQTLLFSATMPLPIQKLAKTFLREPEFIKITKKETASQNIQQICYVIHESERDDALVRLLDAQEEAKSIIFCRTKKDVDRVSSFLTSRGYGARGLHGDMEQPQRQRVIDGFRQNEFQILAATDVAARGLNVLDVTHVYNYHLPYETESYVHRIGRTGRAGNKGIAITLLNPREVSGLKHIFREHGGNIEYQSIPTLQDVKRKFAEKFLKKVQQRHFDQEAHALLTELQKEMSLEEISVNLLSLLLDYKKVEGPEHIGIHPQDIERSGGSSHQKRKRGGFSRDSNNRFRDRGRRPPSRSSGSGAPYRSREGKKAPHSS
ncbi:MAG: DEAD/DEAH box helicase [Parachlamydia sp.]|nr:DEAD/DEAH box helicase [Parachlamydia acanthamoebae]